MAKKKKAQVKEADKLFQVYNNIYTELNWPIGWENESPEDLAGYIVDFVYEKQFTENDPIPVPKDIVLHQTLNSFKGYAEGLKAFLFLDTSVFGGMRVATGENTNVIPGIKGTLVIIKFNDYSFTPTLSERRRVLEIIF